MHKKKTILSRLTLFAIVAISCVCVCDEPLQAANRPNIVVILVDDLGYGDLSSYGATDMQTPHVDQLMRAGMRMDYFYANCPVCSPTRAALLSGRYQELVGVPGVIRTHPENSWGYLAPDAVLLPQILKPAGYHSAIIGKWHLGLEPKNHPGARGFDFFHGFLGDMMDDYYHHRRHDQNYMRRNTETIDPSGHATDLFTAWAVDYIRDRKQRDAPFFLYLAYNAPHTPVQPPEDWLKKVRAREPGINKQRAQLVALIEHLDDGIGQVVAALKETGALENTLLIFTSDNGGYLKVGASNGALRGSKQEMYEGGLRVPMCAVWPGKIAPETRSDHIALTMDLFPTVAAAAGAKIDHQIDGLSILPVLRGESVPQFDRDLFFTRREGGRTYGGKTIDAVRSGDWKLLQNSPYEPLELYNLKDDPLEKNNLIDKRPKIRQRLSAAQRRQIQRSGRVPWQRP
ncbi:Arylsulfatase [Symmachiella dynata]|uniref:Arylsulfatase n=1 Tax=Symmachiella dynata TaxID=2527995 RepID=A0A517ZS28_9PLAN|nr:sulfatase-like hydrolase/transferase [Symmachiella dynata]QDU45253.1 Arylsulfatase [Symmachiella dynata]